MSKHSVLLTAAQRSKLTALVRSKRTDAYRRRHARMLLAVDEGPGGPALSDVDIAAALGCTVRTVARRRQRCVERGVAAALEHGNRGSARVRVRRLEATAEAHLIALLQQQPPAGRSRWCLRSLADHLVASGHVDQCSHMTVHRTLKRNGYDLT